MRTGGPREAYLLALWLMHGIECVPLLEEHGQHEHAMAFSAALNALIDIFADEVGRASLRAAMERAAVDAWGPDWRADAPGGEETVH